MHTDTIQGMHQHLLNAIRMHGRYAFPLSDISSQPLRLQVISRHKTFSVILHCSRLIPEVRGQGHPDLFHFRFPRTGPRRPGAQGDTVILGWWPAAGICVGFAARADARRPLRACWRHVRETTLLQAYVHGLAVEKQAQGCTAIAFPSDALAYYLEHSCQLHALARSHRDAELLCSSVQALQAGGDDLCTATHRHRRVISATRRFFRKRSFAARVLCAYGGKCAVCWSPVAFPEATHIAPGSSEDAVSTTSNGLALCPNHRTAYETALITVDEWYRVLVSRSRLRSLGMGDDNSRASPVLAGLRPYVLLPPEHFQRPRGAQIREGQRARGWQP